MLLIKYYWGLLLISFSYSLALSKTTSEPAEYDKECFDKLFPSKSISGKKSRYNLLNYKKLYLIIKHADEMHRNN